ncbi:MAG TPA: PKD domain-containing protein, partial [Roseiflexaceae bacterium]|nr:PKD domain-containing protein [Roseiflexaceae bacterium]
SGGGASVAHRYLAEGSYTANVTAKNTAGSVSFPVTVDVLPSSVSATVTPNQGIVETDDGTFRAFFPTNAVTTTVQVTYTAHITASQPLTNGLGLLRDFTLEATLNGAPVLHFERPYTVTLRYTDAEIAAGDVEEASLKVLFWDGAEWADLSQCQGCAFDAVNNRITLVLDGVGEFALVGAQRSRILLPIVLR